MDGTGCPSSLQEEQAFPQKPPCTQLAVGIPQVHGSSPQAWPMVGDRYRACPWSLAGHFTGSPVIIRETAQSGEACVTVEELVQPWGTAL